MGLLVLTRPTHDTPGTSVRGCRHIQTHGEVIMFAIIAAILFGVALLLDILDTAGDLTSTLVTGGLLCIAVHLATGTPIPAVFRPNR